ncbi:hypothetical protein OAR29_03910 [Rhodospirillales bacterium]|nr:hypothetical protein [Rhodospirillales bacterium]
MVTVIVSRSVLTKITTIGAKRWPTTNIVAHGAASSVLIPSNFTSQLGQLSFANK